MAATRKVKHVVADSAAFIRHAPLQDLGENIYTLHDVVAEIRDKQTLQRLQVLPYELKFREPTTEAIHAVSEFAKKTGDYRGLSAVDLRVLALTYQLEKEHGGGGVIKEAPLGKSALTVSERRPLEKSTDTAGFYLPNNKNVAQEGPNVASNAEINGEIHQTPHDITAMGDGPNAEEEISKNLADISLEQSATPHTECEQSLEHTRNEYVVNITVVGKSDANEDEGGMKQIPVDGAVLSSDLIDGTDSEDESDEEEDEEDDDDGGGWITPGNIQDIKGLMRGLGTETADVCVACLTTDFSMQNVLIQMGLNVLAVDGLLIKRAKSYVLRCFACFKITMDVSKQFCPHCGNETLQRVSMTTDADGGVHYFLSRRKPVSRRGLKYSLPQPHGGKHAQNPRLCEDQPYAQQRTAKKSQAKLNVFDPAYGSTYSPFLVTDTTSRAAQLGIRGDKPRGRGGNSRGKQTGRRK